MTLQNEPQWTYQDIVNHFVKIIGNGTFTVETINESILLKMLDSKGIKIPVEKSYRDIDKDYKMHLQDIGITMNKPQLSAEMKYMHIDWKDMYKDELAQELADEREKVLSEVEGWLVDVKEPKSGISDYVDDFARHSVNEYCAVLRTKLNQLKGH